MTLCLIRAILSFLFFIFKLILLYCSWLNYTKFSHQVCSHLFIFPNDCQPFLFLLHSLHLPHLLTFFITLQLPFFFLYKNFHLLSFPHIIWFSSSFKAPSFSHSLSRLSSSPQMAPKAKKTSYVLFSDTFFLIHWSGAVRLMKPPSLTYRPENHIPIAEFVSFSNFSHFQVSLWFFVLIFFLPCKCLSFVVGWV